MYLGVLISIQFVFLLYLWLYILNYLRLYLLFICDFLVYYIYCLSFFINWFIIIWFYLWSQNTLHINLLLVKISMNPSTVPYSRRLRVILPRCNYVLSTHQVTFTSSSSSRADWDQVESNWVDFCPSFSSFFIFPGVTGTRNRSQSNERRHLD